MTKTKQECLICGDDATHFPVYDWAGSDEPYCCFCFSGTNECEYCD